MINLKWRGKPIFNYSTTTTTEVPLTPELLQKLNLTEEALADRLEEIQSTSLPSGMHAIRIRTNRNGDHCIAVDHEKEIDKQKVVEWVNAVVLAI